MPLSALALCCGVQYSKALQRLHIATVSPTPIRPTCCMCTCVHHVYMHAYTYMYMYMCIIYVYTVRDCLTLCMHTNLEVWDSCSVGRCVTQHPCFLCAAECSMNVWRSCSSGSWLYHLWVRAPCLIPIPIWNGNGNHL